MAISRESRKLIEGRRFDELEDEWLSRLEQRPLPLDYFVGVARALGGNGEDERAQNFLELLDEQLRAADAWSDRLQVLEYAGPLLFPEDGLHQAVLETLRKLHAERENVEGLIEWVGLERATHDIPKTWEKVATFNDLVQFDTGSIVWMKGRGAGRVADVNFGLGKIKVDFEGLKGLGVGLKAAAKVLKPLEAGHFLRRKIEEPEVMKELAKESPSDLLRLVLESSDEPLNATKVRTALKGIVADKKWSSWWTAARNHPQLVVSGKGARQVYAWAASSEAAREDLEARFAAADVGQKLEIFRREAKRDADIKGLMAAALAEAGERVAVDDPATALTIWWTLDKQGATPDGASWRPAEMLRQTPEPDRWLEELADRDLRRSVLDQIRAARDDWGALWQRWMPRESDPKLLTYVAKELKSEDSSLVESFVDDVLAKPPRHPEAFVWLLEQRKLVASRNPLRLLQQALGALTQSEFARLRNRIEGWVESSGAVADLIARLDADQAEQAERSFERAPLEEYVRTRLITALHLKFPELRDDESEALYAKLDSIEKRRKELKELKEKEIPANRRAIEEARALGDLRENFEYKSARQRHEYLSARLAKLENQLANARPINFDVVDGSEMRVGALGELESTDGEKVELAILGPWESDPEQGVLSYQSETAQGLLGKKPGDTVSYDGRTWTIAAIRSAAT